jgi:hypothetical protein
MFALLKKPVRRTSRPLETEKRTLNIGDRAMPLTIRETPARPASLCGSSQAVERST